MASAWDINQVTLIGRLVKDPELRYTQSGLAICPISIAVNRKARREEASDEVYFFDVITFGKTAEMIGQYLAKGRQVAVQGYLKQSRWEDQNGGKRYKVEIISERVQFLSSPTNTKTSRPNQDKKPKEESEDNLDDIYDDLSEDDEIPF